MLTGAATTTLYITLKNGSFTQFVLPKVQSQLKGAGVEIRQLEVANIDLLGSVELQGIDLYWQDAEMGFVEVQGEYLALEYDLNDIWNHVFQLTTLQLRQTDIRANLKLPESSPTKKPEEAVAEGVPWQDLLDLLNAPPMQRLTISEIAIDDIALDLTLEVAEQQVEYQGSLERLAGNLEWITKELSGELSFKLASAVDQSLHLKQLNSSANLLLKLQPSLESSLSWSLRESEGRWLMKSSFNHLTELKRIVLSQESEEGSQRIDSDQFHLSIKQNNSGVIGRSLDYSLNLDSRLDELKLTHQSLGEGAQSITLNTNSYFEMESEGSLKPSANNNWESAHKTELSSGLKRFHIDLLQGGNQRLTLDSEQLGVRLAHRHQGAMTENIEHHLELQTEISPLALTMAAGNVGEESQTKISLTPSWDLKQQGNLSLQADGDWSYDNEIESELKLGQLGLIQNSTNEGLEIKVDEVILSLDNKHQGGGAKKIESKLSAQLQSSPLILKQSGAEEDTTALELKPQLQFTHKGVLLLNNDRQWDLDNRIEMEIGIADIGVTQQLKGLVNKVTLPQLKMALNHDHQGVIEKGLQYQLQLETALSDLKLSRLQDGIGTLSFGMSPKLLIQSRGEIHLQAELPLEFSNHLNVESLLRDFKFKQSQNGAGQEGELSLVSNQLGVNLRSESSGTTAGPLSFDLSLQSNNQKLGVQQRGKEGGLSMQLYPDIALTAEGVVADFENPLPFLELQLRPEIHLNDLNVIQSQGDTDLEYRVDELQLLAKVDIAKGQYRTESDLLLEEIALPDLDELIDWQMKSSLEGDFELRKVNLSLNSRFNQEQLLELGLSLDNSPKNLSVEHQFNLQVPTEIPKAWSDLADLDRLLAQYGSPQVESSGLIGVRHDRDTVLEIDSERWQEWGLEGRGGIKVGQQRPASDPDGLYLQAPLEVAYQLKNQPLYQIELSLDAPGVKIAPLQAAIPLSLAFSQQFDWPVTTAKLKGQVKVDNEEAVSYHFNVIDKAQKLGFDGDISLMASPRWQGYLSELAPLEQIGKVSSRWQLEVDLAHPYPNLTTQLLSGNSVSVETLLDQKADFSLVTELEQAPGLRGSLVEWHETIVLKQQLNHRQEGAKWQSEFNLPHLLLTDQVEVEHLEGDLDLAWSDILDPRSIQLNLQIQPAEVTLLQSVTASENGKGVTESATPFKVGKLLTPLSLKAEGQRNNEQLEIPNLSLTAGDPFLSLELSAQGDVKSQEGYLESLMKITLDHQLETKPAMQAKGEIELPLQLNLVKGSQLSLEGGVKFSQLDLNLGGLSLKKLDGKINVEEELLWKNEEIHFRYLIPSDPFQRVNYSLVQPYLPEQTLTFERFSMPLMDIGPGLAGLSLQQNLFQLQPFNLDLLGGHISGQFYLDASPEAWKVGLLSRITQIDLRDILPDHSPLKNEPHSPITARTALTFDIQSRLLEGRVDITAISRQQLLQLLEVVDPDYQDEQLATLRTALRLAHPEWLAIKMESGLMDMEVKISLIPNAIKMRNLPLTPLINHFGATAFTALEQLPLH